MPAQPRARRGPASLKTSLETSASLGIQHLVGCLQEMGATAITDKVERCCTHFRVLTCNNGHVYRRIPAERCRLRLGIHGARWRPQRAITQLWPAIQTLCRRDPADSLRRGGQHAHASPDGSARVRAAVGTHGAVWTADRCIEPGGGACRRNPTHPDRRRAGSP